jgi:ABC-type transporter Mla maintaining outer membrane lipid asymmetry permease subunit MlaE
VLQSLSARDVWLTVAKAFAFGLIVGIVPSYVGLSVRRAATEVPIAVSRATVFAIVAVFLCSALFVAFG